MSVAEMKLIAIAEIGKLETEDAVKEILTHLKSISHINENKIHNLTQHFDTIQKQYGNVLKKLAQ
jgi:hypothetical protein